MSDTMYYEKPALLNRDQHRQRRVKPSTGYGFARKANSMFVAGVEFANAGREYPIVFSRNAGGGVLPVAMLGLRNRENLFIDAQDRWSGAYIPAFVRRYPFVLAHLPGQSMGVCMDEAYAGFSETEGEALFDAEGKDTPFLQHALEFLRQYQLEYQRTEAFCKELDQVGLFKEMNAKADLADGRSFSIHGLLVVDEAKLMALPDAQVLALFRSGNLHLVSLHLASLANMQKLVDRLAQRPGPLPVPG
ncbi:MAG TPA: SapC family protein [Ramlibacter sp.]|nr:SapC family protein [Ramlibacter sp.]